MHPEFDSFVLPSRDGLVPSTRAASVFSNRQKIATLRVDPHSSARSSWSIGLIQASSGGQQDYRFESVNLCLDCFRSRSQSSTSEYEKKLNWYNNKTDGRAYVCTSFRHPFLICLTFNPSWAHGALPVAYENNRSNFSCLVTGESPNCCTICSVTAIGP